MCISHAEDPDGLICAAYLKRIKKAYIKLVSYDEIERELMEVEPPLDELYLCDLNIREELSGHVLRINSFSKVTIIDHHPTSSDTLNLLERSGVEVVYSIQDCASVLFYNKFARELGREGARLAIYAAISDQFDDGPIASKLMLKLDRQFVQHEALLLTHALHRRTDDSYRLSVMKKLSSFTPPHQIEGVLEAAVAQLDHVSQLLESLPKKASVDGGVATVESITETSLGSIAGLLIDALDVDVGICFKRMEGDTLNISVRARRGLDIHLGEVTKLLANKYDGFGGGHSRASGASIPINFGTKFVEDLKFELNSQLQSKM